MHTKPCNYKPPSPSVLTQDPCLVTCHWLSLPKNTLKEERFKNAKCQCAIFPSSKLWSSNAPLPFMGRFLCSMKTIFLPFTSQMSWREIKSGESLNALNCYPSWTSWIIFHCLTGTPTTCPHQHSPLPRFKPNVPITPCLHFRHLYYIYMKLPCEISS